MAMEINDIVGGRGGFGFGGGGEGGLLAGVLIASLLRRGGLGGEGGECVNETSKFLDAAILNAVNGLTADVPTTALETQASINHSIGALALGTQQGFANVKDSVQASAAINLASTNEVERTVLTTTAALLTAVKDGNYATTTAIRDDGDKTRAKIDFYHDQDMQRRLTIAESALARQEFNSRIRDVEVSVTNTATATQVQGQAQGQAQQQLQISSAILAALNNLAGDIQAVKQGQVIFNSGTMAASGTQAAANTKVA